MPSFGPAFDKNAFDVGAFDSLYVVPLLYNISINREHRKIVAGEAIEVTIHIQAVNGQGQRYSLNTATLPVISIYNPDGTLLVTTVDMYNNSGSGVYSYQYQTIVGDVKGAYAGVFKAVNGDRTMVSDRLVLFEIV